MKKTIIVTITLVFLAMLTFGQHRPANEAPEVEPDYPFDPNQVVGKLIAFDSVVQGQALDVEHFVNPHYRDDIQLKFLESDVPPIPVDPNAWHSFTWLETEIGLHYISYRLYDSRPEVDEPNYSDYTIVLRVFAPPPTVGGCKLLKR